MKKATMTLRVKKLTGDAFQRACIHNGRNQTSKHDPSLTHRSDPNRLYMNHNLVNPKYAHIKTSEQLWALIRENFDKAKQEGKIERKRFIPRTTNRRGRKPVETSIVREIVLQIGHAQESFKISMQIYNEFLSWLKKWFPGDIIRIDIHNDEGARHIHILVTTWSLKHSHNYTKNNLVDQYKLFQRKTYLTLKEISKKFDIDIIPPIPKIESGMEHLPPSVYDRYALEINDCKRYLEELRWEISKEKKENRRLHNENHALQLQNSELEINKDALWGEVNRLKYDLDSIFEYCKEEFLDDMRILSRKFLENKLAKLELTTYSTIQSFVLEILDDEEKEYDEEQEQSDIIDLDNVEITEDENIFNHIKFM